MVKCIGLTGGVGMGKSTVGSVLASKQCHVIDTDDVARSVVRPGTPAHAEIVSHFGPSVLQPDGAINRKALGAIVFNDPDQLAALNRLTHPRIREAWLGELNRIRKESPGMQVVVLIPLLFETGSEAHFDCIVCVACSAASQLDRLRQRGWADDHSLARINSQMPVREKIRRSDFLIWCEGPMELVGEQANRVLRSIGSIPTDPHSGNC